MLLILKIATLSLYALCVLLNEGRFMRRLEVEQGAVPA